MKKIFPDKTFKELITEHELEDVVSYLYCLRIDLLDTLNTYYPTLTNDDIIISDLNLCYYGVCNINETVENMIINGTTGTISESGIVETYTSPIEQIYYIIIKSNYSNTLYRVYDIANDDTHFRLYSRISYYIWNSISSLQI